MEIILPANELVFVVLFCEMKRAFILTEVEISSSCSQTKIVLRSVGQKYFLKAAKKKKTFKEKYIIITADTIGLHST